MDGLMANGHPFVASANIHDALPVLVRIISNAIDHRGGDTARVSICNGQAIYPWRNPCGNKTTTGQCPNGA